MTNHSFRAPQPPEGITEAQLCGLGGARFENLPHGEKNLTVNVGSNAHPI